MHLHKALSGKPFHLTQPFPSLCFHPTILTPGLLFFGLVVGFVFIINLIFYQKAI